MSNQGKRRKILFATWKDRLDYSKSIALAREIVAQTGSLELAYSVVLCPSSIALVSVGQIIRDTNIGLGAQNVFWKQKSPCTGEIRAETLVEIGCKFVILGHSERKVYLGESEEMIYRKVAAALEIGLHPIICVGESFEAKKKGVQEQIVENQLLNALKALESERQDPRQIVIAYEPAWAISTSEVGIALSPTEANKMHEFIRTVLADKFSTEFASNITIVYGGSMDNENAEKFFSEPEIDGGLVGSATQSIESFIKLVKSANRAYDRLVH